MYDSEQILAANPATERTLFQKPVGQLLADGSTTKTLLHTNMRSAGSLGTPISFDMYGFNVRYPKGITYANLKLLLASGLFQFVLGADTTFLTVPIEEIPSGTEIVGAGATDIPVVGTPEMSNFYKFDIGGRGLHLNSTENFSVKISWPSSLAGITGNQLLRVYLRGVQYRGV